jgi:hypothetical protein
VARAITVDVRSHYGFRKSCGIYGFGCDLVHPYFSGTRCCELDAVLKRRGQSTVSSLPRTDAACDTMPFMYPATNPIVATTHSALIQCRCVPKPSWKLPGFHVSAQRVLLTLEAFRSGFERTNTAETDASSMFSLRIARRRRLYFVAILDGIVVKQMLSTERTL